MPGATVLSRDFSAFIASLNAREVRYLIVGGYAVAFHGHPRYTKDLDVWIERSPENAERLLQALDDFGFGSLGLTVDDFLTPDRVVQLGYPPARIDLLTSCVGVHFDASYAERESVVMGDVEVPFIGLDALRENKRALGRNQDLADLDHLE